jgi:hypothetical protein
MATRKKKVLVLGPIFEVTEEAINEQLNRAALCIDQGFTSEYAQGAMDALNWVTGDNDEPPFQESLEGEEG